MSIKSRLRKVVTIILILILIAFFNCKPDSEKKTLKGGSKKSKEVSKAVLDENLKAVAKFEQAFQKSPDDKMIKENLITAYMKTGSYYHNKKMLDEALDYYNKALALDPERTQILRYVGKAQFESGRQDEAINTFKKLNSLNPYEFKGHFYLAQIYSARQELDLAIDEFNKALLQSPADMETNKGLLLVYKKKGDSKKAAEIEQKIEEIKNNTYIPDRGYREKLGREWREQFVKNPTDYRALYNFAASQFKDKLEFYVNKHPSELSIGDIRAIRGAMSGLNAYVKIAKDIPEERPYYEIMKAHKKRLSGIVEKRIHAIRAEYAKKGEPIPKELTEMPSCSESDLLKEVRGKEGGTGGSSEDDDEE